MYHPENLPCETSDYFVPYVDYNQSINFINQLWLSRRVLYYFKAKQLISKLLDKYQVDIVHLHNIHHQISPSILHVLKKRKIPIIMTLHDYKMVCASYNMLIEERPCEICVRGRHYKAIMHRCLKDSYLKSALATLEMYLHHKILDIYNNVDIFISPSVFLRNKLIEMGFKKEIVYLMNFIDIQRFEEFVKEELEHRRAEEGNSFVYFGRLTQGKGLKTLLEAANLLRQKSKDKKIKVKIIGDGPVKEELQKFARETSIDNVKFLGYLSGKELYQEVKNSIAVLLASEWYENNPMCIIEAFALGKPVIGSRIAGIPEMVKDYETGLTFEPKSASDLCSKMEFMINNSDKTTDMGINARAFVKREMNPEKHYQKLMEIYKQAMAKKRN
jgi:glycosyltransferase involved in cell wall biosynthesis